MITFGYPWLLLLLLLLPLAAWLLGKRGSPPAFVYSSIQFVRGLSGVHRSRAGAALLAFRWLALSLLIMALAQPRFTRSETRITASGVDIMVALDMSGSMAAEDFELKRKRVNRFEMARTVLKNFIEKRPNDRIGLVVFGTQAYVSTPLTLDHEFLNSNLDRLKLGDIDQNRTAIGSAISTAVNRLREVQSKSKIAIVMTDGQNNSGKVPPLTAAEAAQALGTKVYTIGVGTHGQAPVPAGRNPFTGETMYQMQPVDIDEDTLKEVARKTGAQYFRADNAGKFEAIYAEIDQLEKTEKEVKKYAHHRELFAWLIGPGMGFLLLETWLRHTLLRRLP
jgi:Ca-activated chloride channel family protein